MRADLREVEARFRVVEEILPTVSNELLRLQKGQLDIQTKRNEIDLVTEADLKSEAILRECMEKHFPEDGILAEEGGMSGSDEGFLWVIDPVDGTINYAHGLPLFSVAIGLQFQRTDAGGIVELPALSRRYRAISGQGSTCNGEPLRVSSTDDLSKALVVTGFPYDRKEQLDRLLTGVRLLLTHTRGIRRTGSAALDLCWLAEGYFDAHYELNLSPWDTCAAGIVAREAGAKLTDLHGAEHNPYVKELVSSNGWLHASLLQLLSELQE